jgi:hypothetical protein
LGKFDVNHDHFENEKARMYYVFNCTDGDSQKHLYVRYNPQADHRFTTAQEMIDYLAEIHINPHRVEEARYEYQALQMKYNQPFFEFKTQFLHLANEAKVSQSEWFSGLYNKLTYALQTRLAPQRYTFQQNFQKLCEAVGALDTELKRLNQIKLKDTSERQKPSTVVVSTPAELTTTRGLTPGITSDRVAIANPTTSATPAPEARRLYTPAPTVKPVTCFNCEQTGHISKDCTKPRRTDLKDIEDDEDTEPGKDYA